MNNFLFTCIVILFPFLSFSQSDVEVVNATIGGEAIPKVKRTFHEIGINSTSVLGQFLKFDENETLQSPYLLTYKFGWKKHTFRAGIGLDISNSESFIDGTTDKITSNVSDLNWRVGYEYRINFGKKCLGTFGADFIGRTTRDELISDTSFDRVTISENSDGFGGGVVIGLQYKLTKRLMLGTEGAFYYMQEQVVKNNIFENNQQFDADPEVTNTEFTLNILPSTIFLIFHF